MIIELSLLYSNDYVMVKQKDEPTSTLLKCRDEYGFDQILTRVKNDLEQRTAWIIPPEPLNIPIKPAKTVDHKTVINRVRNALVFNGWCGVYREYHKYPRCIESYDEHYEELLDWDRIYKLCGKDHPSLIEFVASEENQGRFWEYVDDIDGNRLWTAD